MKSHRLISMDNKTSQAAYKTSIRLPADKFGIADSHKLQYAGWFRQLEFIHNVSFKNGIHHSSQLRKCLYCIGTEGNFILYSLHNNTWFTYVHVVINIHDY